MRLRPLAVSAATTLVIVADLASPSHAAAVVNLLDEYARDEMGGGVPLSEHVRANLVPELRRRPGALAVLAFVDGEPAGLAICIEGFSTFACQPLLNVHDVVVHRTYRGRGLARLLLEKAEAVARERGCCKLTLEVLEGNHHAQAVYRACGYAGYELNPRMGRALFWQKKLGS